MKTSPELDQISTALSLAQGAIKPASKDSTNPHFKSKYADLASVIEAIREPLSENGLSIVQDSMTCSEGIAVWTRILHNSGQWIETGPLTVPMSKLDAHGVGSASSYAKRYSILGALNVSSMDLDDDGNEASIGKTTIIAVPVPPAGFENWLDDLRVVSDEGQAALKRAWTASAKPMRAHLTAHQPDVWTNLKAAAAAVDLEQPA
jgi:hypothetical protein|tara:strand:- start:259 stop:873 length:615 start_codon:yes stop_codon:yes gene_type:complete